MCDPALRHSVTNRAILLARIAFQHEGGWKRTARNETGPPFAGPVVFTAEP